MARPSESHIAAAPSGTKRSEPEHLQPAVNVQMLEALGRLRVIMRAIRAHYQSVASAGGLGGAQLWALSLVDQVPGIKVGELARRMAIHQSTASNMVERLVQQRLLQRRTDSADQRVVRLYLRASGRKKLDAAPAPAQGVLQAALESLPADHLQALTRLLDEVIAALPPQDKRARHRPLAEILGIEPPQTPPRGARAAAGGAAPRKLAAAPRKSTLIR